MNRWRQIIENTYAARTNPPGTESRPFFSLPGSVTDVEAAENRLAFRFPNALRSFLLESDGLMDQMSVDGGTYFDNIWLLWPIQQIIDENLVFRKRFSNTSSEAVSPILVIIAGSGVDGILFGFESNDRPCDDCSIVSWHPVEQKICSLADSLAGFLDGWLCNRIFV
jgi:hypothetical protein